MARAKRAAKPTIKAVILALDPENDAHWVMTGPPVGKPRVAAVASSVQDAWSKTNMTRGDIEDALPGWNRDKAMERSLNEAIPF